MQVQQSPDSAGRGSQCLMNSSQPVQPMLWAEQVCAKTASTVAIAVLGLN